MMGGFGGGYEQDNSRVENETNFTSQNQPSHYVDNENF